MRNIILIAVIAMFAFTTKPSSPETTGSPKKDNCGPVLVFTNSQGASVQKIVVDWGNPAHTDLTFNNPTFPFNTTRCCGGMVTVIIHFNSGAGYITVTEYPNQPVACETYEAPYLSPVPFFGDCADYYIDISSAGCP